MSKKSALRAPLAALITTLQDGRFMRGLFLAMLALSVGTVGYDFQQMVAAAPDGLPGSKRLEPLPMELPRTGDQTRPYLPRTMPLGPGRGKPQLPGYFGPVDGEALAAPMKFVRGPEGKATAIGTIDANAAERLKAFLKTHDREISEISLHSPGGSVGNALAMSRAIREAGVSTRVPNNGYCASSCPLVLAGGLYRKAGERAFIGVHQVYALPNVTGTLQRGMADAQAISAACQQLLVDMGVDLKIWVRAMATPPQDLYMFTPEELARFDLANGPRPTTKPRARPKSDA